MEKENQNSEFLEVEDKIIFAVEGFSAFKVGKIIELHYEDDMTWLKIKGIKDYYDDFLEIETADNGWYNFGQMSFLKFIK